jgi:hypothetical protein
MAPNSKYILPRRRLRRRRRSLPFLIVGVVIFFFFVVALLDAPSVVTVASAYALPPPWSPTYNTTESLITMQCNSSGYSNPNRGSEFGIVSYDWSNAKRFWSQNQPMDCEEKLIEQVEILATAIATASKKKEEGGNNNNNTNPNNKRIFIYRNIVKALPWFSTVRNKLLDPAYDGFFLNFKQQHQQQQQQYDNDNDNDNLIENNNDDNNHSYHVPKCAAENKSICSNLYHDQGQTPQVPTKSNPNPDGHCNPDFGCNCGNNLPCGEYIFDHRNGTMLRTWLIEEVLLGPTGIGHKYVDGVFLDDYWCSDILCHQSNNDTNMGCPCNDPKQGPTEINQYAAIDDIGLSDIDIMDITLEWNKTMNLALEKILQRKAYTWSLMDGQENANAQPYLFNLLPSIVDDKSNDDDDKKNNNNNNNNDNDNDNDNDNRNRNDNKISERCIEILEDACRDESDWQLKPRLFGFTVNRTSNNSLSQFELDWSFFLLVRGAYTWAGWGIWGMTWPFNYEPSHGQTPAIPHGGVPLPKLLTPDGSINYGIPLGTCYQTTTTTTTTSSGIFRRNWTNGYVEINCNNKQQQQQQQQQHKYNKSNKSNDHSESIVGGVVTSRLIFNDDLALPHKKENEDAHTYSTS